MAAGLSLLACQNPHPSRAPEAALPAEPASPQFIDDGFSRLYQIFLRRTLTSRQKTERWVREYKSHWVHWTGQLVAFSPTGLKFKHIQSTVTFDVSVIVNQPQRGQLRTALKIGKFYTYIARLDSYDDVFRTLYFDQGVILKPSPEGVPGQLVPMPPPLPSAGVPPKTAPARMPE